MEQSDRKMIWYNQLIDLEYKSVIGQFACLENQSNGQMKGLQYQVQVLCYLQSNSSLLVYISCPKTIVKIKNILYSQ